MSSHNFKPGLLSSLANRTSCQRQRGFTIIEVLVSIVIFSIGLIGVARLQVVAKQSNYDAVQRVTATAIAQDILSKLRSNAKELDTYVSNTGSRTIQYDARVSEPTPVCDSANTCTPTQVATHDLWEVLQEINGVSELDSGGNATGGLSLATVCISAVDESGNPVSGGSAYYTVAIAWRGKAELTNPTLNTCGDATGFYGASNEYRRLLVMSTFITSI